MSPLLSLFAFLALVLWSFSGYARTRGSLPAGYPDSTPVPNRLFFGLVSPVVHPSAIEPATRHASRPLAVAVAAPTAGAFVPTRVPLGEYTPDPVLPNLGWISGLVYGLWVVALVGVCAVVNS